MPISLSTFTKSVILLVFISSCGGTDSQTSSDYSECPPSQQGGSVSIRTAILIDPSSQISDYQIETAKSEISDAIGSYDQNDLLEVITAKLGDRPFTDTTSLKKLTLKYSRPVEDCNCNWWKQRCVPKDDYKNWKYRVFDAGVDTFDLELKSHLVSLLKSEPNDSSPILKVLGSLDQNMCDDDRCNHLWVISDMLENSSEFNFYESVPKLEDDMRTIIFHYGFPEKIDSTTIFRINRCGDDLKVQSSNNFETFWNNYFFHVTGNKPKWIYLPTGGCPKHSPSE